MWDAQQNRVIGNVVEASGVADIAVSSVDLFVSIALMPASMALAGPVGEGLGVPATFIGAATVPIVLSVFALLVWRLPADEIAHPLGERVGDPGDPLPASATAP